MLIGVLMKFEELWNPESVSRPSSICSTRPLDSGPPKKKILTLLALMWSSVCPI